jgi:hypothetical protein
MERLFDEFSMSLAASVPRRESLRRMGAVIAGMLLSPLGLASAWAAGPDPCKSFCNRCRNRAQQNQCLAACRACRGNTSRLGGSCGSYVCCEAAACNGVCSDLRSDPNCGACGNDCSDLGETCCGNYCADLANDFDNCGGCGAGCAYPGQYEDGACVDGQCFYWCVNGAVDCGGTCTDLSGDPNNCGACGNVCGGSTPNCYQGACVGGCQGSCPEGWCGGDGCGGECACPAGWECGETGWCSNPCVFPFIPCDGVCVDPTSNRNHCGGCGAQCAPDEACLGGFCTSG